jgi:hypothetical protein
MPRCSHCGETLRRDETVCHTCSQAVNDGTSLQESQLVSIARFRNAAEAGYFAHELHRESSIHAMVSMDENFDALSGYWSSTFVLSVPEDSAEFALHTLQQMMEHADPEDTPFDTEIERDQVAPATSRDAWMQETYDDFASPPEESSNVNWVPIVLTLAAGSVAFWGVRAMEAQPPQAGVAAAGDRDRPDVWNLLSQPKRPWVQQLDKGRRELRFDPVRREGIISEDLDGDGQFESQFRVREFSSNK